MVCGFSRGSVIFLKSTNLEKVYAWFSPHREAVKCIVEMNHKGHFLSYCAENVMVLWGFGKGDDRISMFQEFNAFWQIQSITLNNKWLHLNFISGDNFLFEWKGSKWKLYLINFVWNEEHDGKLTVTDSKQNEGLFATGGVDGFVKIWTYQK